MKAVYINKHGSPEVLTLVDIDEPTITSPTEVKVRLKAAGINPVDTKLRAGAYPINQFPMILGCDGAGVVEEVGNEVTRFTIGDEVYFFHGGGIADIQGNYAEYKVLEEHFIAHKPKSLDFVHAAAAPLVLLTAWESLFDRADVKQDQTVFINAGAGGVGHIAIQLAKSVGAKVCTTVSSDKKAAFVKELGADHIINYKQQDVVEVVMQWTNDEGVDMAMDNVGGKNIQETFPLVKYSGDMVTLLLPDNTVDWSIARFRNIRFSMEVMLSPLLFGLLEAQKHQTWILEQCANLFDEGKLKIHVSDILPLEKAAEAHCMVESGHTTGKLVLELT